MGPPPPLLEPIFSLDCCWSSIQPSPSLCAVCLAPEPKNTKRMALDPCPVPRLAGWQGEGVYLDAMLEECGRKGAATSACINIWLVLPSGRPQRGLGKARSHLSIYPTLFMKIRR